MSSIDVEVLIVGGGPVGLTARALLERWGVSSMLVDKRSVLSPFPRSRLVNVRTMEIFRQLGLAEQIEARAFTPDHGRIRFSDTLTDPDFATQEMVGVGSRVAESPVMGVVSSQDRLEPILMGAASAELRFGVELIGLDEESDGVSAALVDHARGERFTVTAGYVLGADGASSTVRELLGIGTRGPGPVASFTTVVFDADLDRWCAHRPAGVYFTAHGMFAPLYPEGGWAWFGPTPEGADGTDWRKLVTRALGPVDVDVEVLRVQHWTMNAFVAERFRVGRVLVAGDAAHAIPITGGLGMNAGIADAHNLCWKIAGIAHGWAGPGLLDSYEMERKPVAERTLRQAVANAELAMEVLSRRREQLAAGVAQVQMELPWSERFFAQLGLVLGVAYESDAVLPDDTAVPLASDPATDYIQTGRPGHRAPHVWLESSRSSLDALGEWFTLLTPDVDAWRPQIAQPWPLRVEALSQDHADVCGLGPGGALLVRPDGHVAARWHDGPANDTTLECALAAITCPTTATTT